MSRCVFWGSGLVLLSASCAFTFIAGVLIGVELSKLSGQKDHEDRSLSIYDPSRYEILKRDVTSEAPDVYTGASGGGAEGMRDIRDSLTSVVLELSRIALSLDLNYGVNYKELNSNQGLSSIVDRISRAESGLFELDENNFMSVYYSFVSVTDDIMQTSAELMVAINYLSENIGGDRKLEKFQVELCDVFTRGLKIKKELETTFDEARHLNGDYGFIQTRYGRNGTLSTLSI